MEENPPICLLFVLLFNNQNAQPISFDFFQKQNALKLHKCNHLLSEAINNGLANIELAVLSAKAIRRGLSSCFLDVSFG